MMLMTPIIENDGEIAISFSSKYSYLVSRVGYDAFSILQRRNLSESDFNARCDRIRTLYAYYASTITTGHYERRGTHRQ